MKRIVVVCEGQTEETFVSRVLCPHFTQFNINLTGQTIETSPGHKGGGLSYDRVRRHLRNTLRQRSLPIVTTFFDLYGLNSKFPGYEIAQTQPTLEKRLDTLNNEFHRDIVELSECNPARFIPFIQPYEFEALLFSNIEILVSIEPEWHKAANILNKVRNNAESPEHINDRPETKPAKWLMQELHNPGYGKLLYGPKIAERIGLDRIRSECKFFNNWIERIGKVGS